MRGSVDIEVQVKSGFLSKQTSGSVKRWQKRWFVLTDHNLQYFSNAAMKGDAREVVDLSKVASVVHREGFLASFVLVLPDSSIELRAETPEEAGAWVGSICAAVEIIVAQTDSQEEEEEEKQQQQQQQEEEQEENTEEEKAEQEKAAQEEKRVEHKQRSDEEIEEEEESHELEEHKCEDKRPAVLDTQSYASAALAQGSQSIERPAPKRQRSRSEPAEKEVGFLFMHARVLIAPFVFLAFQYAVWSLQIFPRHQDFTRAHDEISLRQRLWRMRKTLLNLVESAQFDTFIVTVICLNTLLMGMVDYSCLDRYGEPTSSTSGHLPIDTCPGGALRNQIVFSLDPVFTMMFLVEAICKIIAFGMYSGADSYLADSWNRLDITIVVVSVVDIGLTLAYGGGLSGVFNGGGGGNNGGSGGSGGSDFKALRLLRILRPLRTLRRFPKLRMMVTAVLSSLPALVNVFVLLCLLLLIFGAVALQLWGWNGHLHGRCRLTPYPIKVLTAYNVTAAPADASAALRIPFPVDDLALAARYLDPADSGVLRCVEAGNEDASAWAKGPFDCVWPMVQPSPTDMDWLGRDGFPLSSAVVAIAREVAGARLLSGSSRTRTRLCDLSVHTDDGDGAKGGYRCAQGTYCGSNYFVDNGGDDGSAGDASEAVLWPLKAAAGSLGLGQLRPRFMDAYIMASDVFTPALAYGFSSDFSTIGMSMLLLFQCVTLEGWSEVMYNVSDGFGSTASSLFFVMLVVFGALFVLNVLLAVVCESYTDAKGASEEEDAEAEEDERQRRRELENYMVNGRGSGRRSDASGVEDADDYDMGYNHISFARMTFPAGPAGEKGCSSCWARLAYYCCCCCKPLGKLGISLGRFKVQALAWVVDDPWVERTVMTAVVGNTLVLALDRYPISTCEANILHGLNLLLTALFTAEVALKVAGASFCEYCESGWNCFDFVVVGASLIEVIAFPTSNATPFECRRGLHSSGIDGGGSGGGALSVLRIMRVFRLIVHACHLRKLIRVIVRMLFQIGNFALLLLLFVYIYALLGMALFANRLRFDPTTGYAVSFGSPGYNEAAVPSTNYDNLLHAISAVFQTLTGEDWNILMGDARRARGVVGVAFYITALVTGECIVLNLFLAVLFDGFEDANSKDRAEEAAAAPKEGGSLQEADRAEEVALSTAHDCALLPDSTRGDGAWRGAGGGRGGTEIELTVRSDSSADRSRSTEVRNPLTGLGTGSRGSGREDGEDGDEEDRAEDGPGRVGEGSSGGSSGQGEQDGLQKLRQDGLQMAQQHEEEGPNVQCALLIPQHTSLFVFKPTNPFRRWCHGMVTHTHFETAILFLVVISSVLLALESPFEPPDSATAQFLHAADAASTCLFGIELMLKVVALGMLDHPRAYLRGGWNVLDAAVVCVSAAALVLPLIAGDTHSGTGASSSPASDSSAPSWAGSARVLRLLRTLRPLRVISRNEGMRTVVNALILSVPGVLNVAMLCGFFFVVFAIVGVGLFKGALYHCDGLLFADLTPSDGSASSSLWEPSSTPQPLTLSERLAITSLIEHPLPFDSLTLTQQAWGAAGSSYTGATSRAVCNWACAGLEPRYSVGAGAAAIGGTVPACAWNPVLGSDYSNFDNVAHGALLLFEMR
jgi:hypothetical protein